MISSPAVQNHIVYFATSDTGLFHALNAETGAPVFSLDFKGWPMFSSPAIAGTTAYIGSHRGEVIAVDISKHSVAWRFDTINARERRPALTKSDGKPNYEAVFSDSFYDDLVTGTYKMLSVGAVLASPVIADQILYFGDFNGNIYALK